jgi:hypothetical protein
MDLIKEEVDLSLDSLFKKYEYRGAIAYECIFKEIESAYSNNDIDAGSISYFRDELIEKYGWAVPNQEALETMVKWSPHGLIEIGAGGGYWGYLLRQRMRLECHLYDLNPGKPYIGEGITMWTQVYKGSVETLKKWNRNGKTLLLCWPCYNKDWAFKALLEWQSSISPALCYVGEGGGGCTGCDKFHELLNSPDNKYKLVDEVLIPSWIGIHDALYVYKNENYEDEISSSKYLKRGYEKIKDISNE